MSNWEKLRSLTVGKSSTLAREAVEIEGAEFEIRQLTVAERDGLFDLSREAKGDQRKQLGVNMVVRMVHDPESGRALFDETNIEAMLNSPAGGWFDTLSEHCFKVLNIGAEAPKNSEATPAAS